MRPPHELNRVPWQNLTHAYGSAEDLPGLLRALYGDEEAVDEALFELHGLLHGDATVHATSAVHAVPFLAHAALHSPSRRRADVLMTLALFAETQEDTAVRAAVAREVPALLPCLHDAVRDVRRAALRVPASVADLLGPDVREAVLAAADELYAADPAVAVRADAMALRALLSPTDPAPLDSPLPAVRLAAAVLAAVRSGPPYAPEVVQVLAEAEPEREPEDDEEDEEEDEAAAGYDLDPGGALSDDCPWPGTRLPGTQVSALGDVLEEDPDAAFHVAARWVADGDGNRRGTDLAERIVSRWRDREPAFLALALDALPLAQSPGELANRIGVITRWVALHPEPGVRLRDTLYAHASGAEALPAKEALLALARARDTRALGLLPALPVPSALRAAAVHFPAESARLVPVLRRELAVEDAWGGDVVVLIDALAALGPAAVREARGELTKCLREDRAGLTAARCLGDAGVGSREILALLRTAMGHRDAKTRATAAVAHYQLTADPAPTLFVLAALLSSPGEAPWHLSRLAALGPAASSLLPRVEPLLTEPYEPTRVAAAQAAFWLTGDPARATPVLTAAVAPSPTGLVALQALSAMGPVPAGLRPTLREFATSPTRLLGPSTAEEPHPDIQLRTLAGRLLAAA
jgi:hypothetical protein